MRYVLKKSDGAVAIMTTVRDDIDPWTEVQKLPFEELAKIVDIQPIKDEDIPQDRIFRNAWSFSGEKVEVDMPKAREIHKETLRQARAPLMAALDVEQLRGRDVEAQKQALRDITSDPALEAATTPEELKAVWPEALRVETKEN